MERWLACARRAFTELDPDGDGVAQADDIVACLRAKLPPSEVPPLATRPPLTEGASATAWSCFVLAACCAPESLASCCST